MSTTHAPPVHLRRPHVSVWLVAVVGLAAALVVVGTWAFLDRHAGAGGATQDATTLIDDVNTAFSTGNASAIPSLYASNAVIWSMGETYAGMSAIRGLADGSFTAERIAPVTVDGDVATTFVKLTSGAETGTTLSVFQTSDGKIVRQWNFVPGQTPPFDNAVLP